MPMFVSVTSMQMSHKFKRLCQWAVIGGFRSVLFIKHVERWMAKDIRYARNTESGYKNDLLIASSQGAIIAPSLRAMLQ